MQSKSASKSVFFAKLIQVLIWKKKTNPLHRIQCYICVILSCLSVIIRFMDETTLICWSIMCCFALTVKSTISADSWFLVLCSCKTKYDGLNCLYGNFKVTFLILHLVSKQLAGLRTDSSFSQCLCSSIYGQVLRSICDGSESWSWLSSCMGLL